MGAQLHAAEAWSSTAAHLVWSGLLCCGQKTKESCWRIMEMTMTMYFSEVRLWQTRGVCHRWRVVALIDVSDTSVLSHVSFHTRPDPDFFQSEDTKSAPG
eukprot:COSAG02_NODE_7808_length_2837_cov_3.525201_3_plen_100_part_00